MKYCWFPEKKIWDKRPFKNDRLLTLQCANIRNNIFLWWPFLSYFSVIIKKSNTSNWITCLILYFIIFIKTFARFFTLASFCLFICAKSCLSTTSLITLSLYYPSLFLPTTTKKREKDEKGFCLSLITLSPWRKISLSAKQKQQRERECFSRRKEVCSRTSFFGDDFLFGHSIVFYVISFFTTFIFCSFIWIYNHFFLIFRLINNEIFYSLRFGNCCLCFC